MPGKYRSPIIISIFRAEHQPAALRRAYKSWPNLCDAQLLSARPVSDPALKNAKRDTRAETKAAEAAAAR